MPNIKRINIDVFSYKIDPTMKIPFVTSLLCNGWQVTKIAIRFSYCEPSDDNLVKIFNQLSKQTSLQKININGKIFIFSTTDLENIATHSLIKKLEKLTINLNSEYLDEEYTEKIACLFRKNMRSDATITLNNVEISKKAQNEKQETGEFFISENTYSSNYSIHLMWINKIKCNFFAWNKETDEKIMNKAIEWATKNPTAKVFVWYDGQYINNINDSIKNMEKMVENYKKQIIFRDIRNLELIQKNQNDVAFSEFIPVYFRADLAREIVSYEVIKNQETSCCIYADIDIEPISQKELFDEETIHNLNKYGIVVPRAQNTDSNTPYQKNKVRMIYENQFQITVNDNLTLKAIFDTLISFNLAIAKKIFSKQKSLEKNNELQQCTENMEQLVFSTYPVMFDYLNYLKGRVETSDMMPSNEKLITCAVENSWNFCYDDCTLFNCKPLWNFNLKKDIHPFIPTKFIILPTSHFLN